MPEAAAEVAIPARDEKLPPEAENVTAVATTAYRERIAPGRTTADCAVPEDVSLFNKPFENAPAGAAVCVAAAAVEPAFDWVATNKDSSDGRVPLVPVVDNEKALALLAVPLAEGCTA